MKKVIKSFSNEKGKAAMWREKDHYYISVVKFVDGKEKVVYDSKRPTTMSSVEKFDPVFVSARNNYYYRLKLNLKN